MELLSSSSASTRKAVWEQLSPASKFLLDIVAGFSVELWVCLLACLSGVGPSVSVLPDKWGLKGVRKQGRPCEGKWQPPAGLTHREEFTPCRLPEPEAGRATLCSHSSALDFRTLYQTVGVTCPDEKESLND